MSRSSTIQFLGSRPFSFENVFWRCVFVSSARLTLKFISTALGLLGFAMPPTRIGHRRAELSRINESPCFSPLNPTYSGKFFQTIIASKMGVRNTESILKHRARRKYSRHSATIASKLQGSPFRFGISSIYGSSRIR